MENCIFCKIAERKIPANILFENEEMLVFRDVNPVAPEHFLFIPKRHIESMDIISGEDSSLIGRILKKLSEFANENGYNKKGYRIVNNMGEDGGQTVFHLHFHLLAGRQFSWPPG
ncbi:MAG: histidine triad nucleotide-binding protein [Leptospira sp.]|nr:histidine triad nucleotide-binding protein [Leptospira sp.]